MTWFRCGGAGIPAALKSQMNDVLNKKFGTSIDYPPEGWPDDVNLMGPLPEGTATGSLATLEDGADDVPTKSLVVTIPPTLDGVSSISETHTGRNIADVSTATKASEQRCTYVFENGGLTITATGTYARVGFAIPCVKGATYTLSYKGSSDAQYKRVLLYPNELWVSASYSQALTETETAYNTTFIAQSDHIYIGFYLTTTGSTGTETIKDIQIERGFTVHDYEPYQTPTVYTASLGRTIYGGTADIVNGVGSDNCTRIKVSDLNWTYYTAGTNPIFYAFKVPNMKTYARAEMPNIVIDGYTTRTAHSRSYLSTNMANMECSAIEDAQTITFRNDTYTSVADMLAVLGNEYIAYEVTTPTDFVFDGQDINTRLGYNAFWSDSGDTEVTYRRDIDLALQALSGSRGLMMASRPVAQMVGEESDLDQVNELVEDNETEQEDENDAR